MEPEADKPAVSIWFGVALVLQAATAFFYLASGLLAPAPALIPLWLFWGALTFTLIRWRHKGRLTIAVPLATIALWFGYLTLGEQVFGWTA